MWKKSDIPENAKVLMVEGYSELASLVMSKAGIDSKKKAEEFLHSETVHDPAKIKNIEKVAEIIWDHIYSDKKICVFGDYDADGVTGAAILYLALRKLGANVCVRLPDRILEGYGISMHAVKEEISLGAELFITIDNGIKANEEIEEIRKRGCMSVVIDHHQPGDVLPNADALIDLLVEGETYPFRELTGSGLAWKIACYMLAQVDEYDYGMSLVDLAAIGTVADVAPLIGENRSIVKRALKQMQSCRYSRVGVKALYDGQLEFITAEDVAFKLAPCINAPGRLDYRGADIPLLLLLEDKPQIAKYLATRIKDSNTKRKAIQKDWCERIESEVEQCIQQGDKVLVLLAEDAPSGVVGLIAGNLREKYNRPTVVFAPKGDIMGGTIWTGSARSIPGFDILAALKTCEDLFLSYGGHEQAAGVSIPVDKGVLQMLRKRLNEAAAHLTDEDLEPVIYWDMELSEKDLTPELLREMKRLEPFGEGVRKPIFKMKLHTAPKRHCMLGADKSHIKLFCKSFNAVGFSLADKYIRAELPCDIEALGYPFEDRFANKVQHEFKIIDFEPITVQCELRPCKEINE